jgi:hypothetical protein
MHSHLVPLLLFSVAEAAIYNSEAAKDGVELQTGSKISPALDPVSDKKFFDKDYPADKRPATNKFYYFKHPYPAVQDSGDYDKDFIKDENSDGGRWQAQMDYDKMRHEITNAKDKLDELKKKMEEKYEEWMTAKEKAGKAGNALGQANADVAKAKAEADAAEKKVNELEGSSSADGTKVGGAVGDGVKKVEDEMRDLDACKEKLEKAKKKLKRVLEDKEELERKQKEEAEAAAKKREEELKKKHAEAKEAHKKAKQEVEEAEKAAAEEADHKSFDEEAWRKNLEKEKMEHEEAAKNYEKELSDVKKTEDQLARAAENLRKYRRAPYVDEDGGVYPRKTDRSSAIRIGGLFSLIVGVVVAFLA